MSNKVKTKVVRISPYSLPTEKEITCDVERYFGCLPNSKSWIHGEQKDDPMNEHTERRTKIISQLKNIKIPEQRTTEWYAQRNKMITASDIGTAIGSNPHEPQYHLLMKKITEVPFLGAKACYHGKKFESIATMIYQYRMNVIVHEYGCVEHPDCCIGASPDGIVDEFKLDGIHKTELVGRMLEIKCPESRQINMKSDNIMDIVPCYYYPQIQIQMECCNLDECDFWQCDIKEYKNFEEFLSDTDPKEPFR